MKKTHIIRIASIKLVLLLLSVLLFSACSTEEEEETQVVNNTIVVPSVLNVEPSDSTSNVPLNSSVSILFSEEMDESSLTTNNTDTECQGSVQVSDDNFETCLQFANKPVVSESSIGEGSYGYQLKPTALLSALTNYKIKITSDLKSANNVSISEGYETPNGFTTGVHVTIPVVESTLPRDYSVQIAVDSTIDVTFSEAMDPQSFQSGSFQVTTEGGATVPGTIELNGLTAAFTPDSRLETGTTYNVTLETDISNLQGQSLESAYQFSFTTGPINIAIDYAPDNTTESGSTNMFTVVLNSEPLDDVVLTLNSSDTTEGTVSLTTLTFTPSDWSTPQTVTITGVDDTLYDGSVAYSIDFQPAQSDDPNYGGFEPLDILIYNYDNDIIGVQKSKLIADDGMDDDRLATSVSLGKDYAIAGAPYTDDAALSSGSAYVYQRNPANGSWIQKQKLVAEDAGASDYFGRAVAISGDNIVIGSYYDDESGGNAGAVYFYRRNGSSWDFQTKATASGSLANDYLGFSVAIEGDYAVIGATGRDDNGSASGAAYIFKRNAVSGTWFQVDKLLALDGAASDQFGYSVSINGDFIIVGAPYDDDTASNSGSVYLFKKDDGLDTWSEVSKVIAADPTEEDRLGFSVGLNSDHAVAGVPRDDDVASATGSVVVIKRDSGLDTWSWYSKLTASDSMANDQFGWSVAVYGDYIAVGSHYEDNANGSNAGAVYLFQRDTGDGSWDPLSKIVADDGLANDQLGHDVSIYGGNIMAGAYLNNNGNGFDAGAAFIFR